MKEDGIHATMYTYAINFRNVYSAVNEERIKQ